MGQVCLTNGLIMKDSKRIIAKMYNLTKKYKNAVSFRIG